MKKMGLALSGGGFRASLFHLGLLRFLRDAGALSRVSHITSVSGGSILAAHLVLNWDRYNGSASDFDAAAAELIAFARMDVRNRVVRRFPLAMPLRCLRRLVGRSNRKLGRTGLLEYHYERYLYGDVSLFDLPERPQLHILATNLSEGCLCSFNRNGLLMVRRKCGSAFHIDHIDTGLATVAMAVTASSAYPGFFPPLELTGTDVGANEGEFGRQVYTDGGVFDNLGVRMFRCLERPLLAETPLTREDFVDFPAVAEVLRQASQSAEETPMRRLGQLLATTRRETLLRANGSASKAASTSTLETTNGNPEELVPAGLWQLLCSYPLYREPTFAGLKSLDPDVESALQASLHGKGVLEREDQLWLNRELVEAAYRQATGRACLRSLIPGLDCVLVSDVGKPFEIRHDQRAGGLVSTALRATDIVMDRVWQLEIDAFHDAPGFLFAPVTEIVDPADDPTVLHPEVQRQVAHIRTDLDRFSALEVSSLVRHGYCVGRKACRNRPDVFGTDLPADGPWDPFANSKQSQTPAPGARTPAPVPHPSKPGRKQAAQAALDARHLQASSGRRIWSTALDYRDWLSYVYVPIIVPILVLMPYVLTKAYQRSHRINQIVQSLTQGSRDLDQMCTLLDGPIAPFAGVPAEEVRTLGELDLTGFEVLQDIRILDLRNWDPAASGKSAPDSLVYGYRRLKICKRPDHPQSHEFRMRALAVSPLTQIRFPPQQVPARLLKCNSTPSNAEGTESWVASFDFSKVPPGEYVDVIYEHISPGEFLRRGEISTSLSFDVLEETAEMTRWILLPRGKDYRSFNLVRYKIGKPDTVEPVKVVTEYLADDSTILAYKLLSVDPGYTHEVTWYYK